MSWSSDKGGYLPFDGAPPKMCGSSRRDFVRTGIIQLSDIVGAAIA